MTDETTDIVPQGPDQPPPGKKIKVDSMEFMSKCTTTMSPPDYIRDSVDAQTPDPDGSLTPDMLARAIRYREMCIKELAEEKANDLGRQRQGECVWKPELYDPHGLHTTGCGKWHETGCEIIEEAPKNPFSFCPYCGGELKVLKPTTDGEPT